ncbi:Hsp20/alpha crystallin family protein [Noviherbaspirillum aerium]|uniref:Hsp20/alpha crystallin family protein n=1 Tax=Noviherbaspirillum aerium TaxID=2588497 RepID=UPI00124C1C6D|nr:Hsp20/alpha crystallin family protein [Noviherbaspirillum aerium]
MSEEHNLTRKESADLNTQGGTGKDDAIVLRLVVEDSAEITLLADLPGVPKDRLNLELHSDSLTIEGEIVLDLPQDMESRFAEVQSRRIEGGRLPLEPGVTTRHRETFGVMD